MAAAMAPKRTYRSPEPKTGLPVVKGNQARSRIIQLTHANAQPGSFLEFSEEITVRQFGIMAPYREQYK